MVMRSRKNPRILFRRCKLGVDSEDARMRCDSDKVRAPDISPLTVSLRGQYINARHAFLYYNTGSI